MACSALLRSAGVYGHSGGHIIKQSAVWANASAWTVFGYELILCGPLYLLSCEGNPPSMFYYAFAIHSNVSVYL